MLQVLLETSVPSISMPVMHTSLTYQVEHEGELGGAPRFEGQSGVAGPHFGGEGGQVLDEEVGVETLPLVVALVTLPIRILWAKGGVTSSVVKGELLRQ